MLLTTLAIQVGGLYADTVPGPPPAVPYLDKIGHLLAFGVPAALAWWLGARWLVWVLVAHALVSEIIQGLFTSARVMDPLDTVANLVGIVIGVALARAVRARSAMMSS